MMSMDLSRKHQRYGGLLLSLIENSPEELILKPVEGRGTRSAWLINNSVLVLPKIDTKPKFQKRNKQVRSKFDFDTLVLDFLCEQRKTGVKAIVALICGSHRVIGIEWLATSINHNGKNLWLGVTYTPLGNGRYGKYQFSGPISVYVGKSTHITGNKEAFSFWGTALN